ncbi:hypothetical protein [Blastococcus sp. SYSU DS1021]
MNPDDDVAPGPTGVAARYLGLSAEDAAAHSRRLEDVDGYYFWQPVRGGGALIVSADGSLLFANSSVPFDRHKEAFLAGRRTDPSAFDR